MLGTALLVATVVGSASGRNLTRMSRSRCSETPPHGCILVVLITILDRFWVPFNPLSPLFALRRELSPRDTTLYIGAQIPAEFSAL
jgi:glycerol uptake facilitator-like aquaporin